MSDRCAVCGVSEGNHDAPHTFEPESIALLDTLNGIDETLSLILRLLSERLPRLSK
jgi:hypothetical protein